MIIFGAMSRLLTKNPIAIRQLMSETIFQSNEVDEKVESQEAKDASASVESLESNEAIKDEKLVEKEELSYWGNNEKGILFLVDNSEANFFSEQAQDAFLKTLAALRLSLSDVAVINLYPQSFSISDIQQQLKFNTIVYSTGLGTDYGATFNQVFKEGGKSMLVTYTFEEMLTSNDKKRAFWNAIKEMKV